MKEKEINWEKLILYYTRPEGVVSFYFPQQEINVTWKQLVGSKFFYTITDKHSPYYEYLVKALFREILTLKDLTTLRGSKIQRAFTAARLEPYEAVGLLELAPLYKKELFLCELSQIQVFSVF